MVQFPMFRFQLSGSLLNFAISVVAVQYSNISNFSNFSSQLWQFHFFTCYWSIRFAIKALLSLGRSLFNMAGNQPAWLRLGITSNPHSPPPSLAVIREEVMKEQGITQGDIDNDALYCQAVEATASARHKVMQLYFEQCRFNVSLAAVISHEMPNTDFCYNLAVAVHESDIAEARESQPTPQS